MSTPPRRVICVGALAAVSAWAAPSAPADPFLVRNHGGPADTVQATVASARQRPAGQKHKLFYEVCNRGSKPLVYHWPKPNFENSILSALQGGDCALYMLTAADSVPDDNAPVAYFGQRNKLHMAEAYLPRLSRWDAAKRTLATALYSKGIGPGPRPPGETLPDATVVVEVQVTDNDGQLVHRVRWSAKVGALALKLAPSDEAARAEIAQQLKQSAPVSDYSAVLSADELHKTLVGSKPADLPDSIREGHFARVVPNKPGEGQLMFSFKAGGSSPTYEPIVIQDRKGQLLWIIRYGTARRD